MYYLIEDRTNDNMWKMWGMTRKSDPNHPGDIHAEMDKIDTDMEEEAIEHGAEVIQQWIDENVGQAFQGNIGNVVNGFMVIIRWSTMYISE
jgi:hypothetical protein